MYFNDGVGVYIKHLIVLSSLLLIFVGCRDKESFFYKVTLLPGQHLTNDSENTDINEVYIISNAPDNTKDLKQLVDNYFKNIPLPGTPNYDIHRRFFKETKNTPRSYRETSFKYDSIDHHLDDEILNVDRIKDENGEFLFYYFYKNGLSLENERISITLHRNSKN
jgi:hypothetical protein